MLLNGQSILRGTPSSVVRAVQILDSPPCQCPSSVIRGVQILDGPFAGILSPLLVLQIQFLEASKFWTVLCWCPESRVRGVQILDGPFAGAQVQSLEASKFWTVPLPVSSPLASAPSAVLRGVQILDSPFAGILSPLLVPQFSF